jgi:large subunit ribosomal protein L24
VLEVLKGEDKIRVEGIFIQKRHVRAGARQNMPSGGILDKPGRIHISNVRLYSEKLEKGVRVGFEKNAEGKLVRVARGQKGAGMEID